MLPVKTIERLVLYKRLLSLVVREGQKYIYSHQLAHLADNTPAQVRRDLMQIGYASQSKQGYHVEQLIDRIREILENGHKQRIVLAGVGNLGRAFLSYFGYRQPAFEIVAAFDNDENKTGRVIAGCRCFPVDQMENKIRELDAAIGIITVPADAAQNIADRMVESGIRAILNFAPFPIRVPDFVLRGQLDITMELEKLAFLTHKQDD